MILTPSNTQGDSKVVTQLKIQNRLLGDLLLQSKKNNLHNEIITDEKFTDKEVGAS